MPMQTFRVTFFVLTVALPCTVSEISTLRVAVCREGYPPYVEIQGSSFVGFELGEFFLNRRAMWTISVRAVTSTRSMENNVIMLLKKFR